MSTSDALIASFELLLNKDTDRFSLEDWQFAYKRVIFNMGLKILNKYPSNAFGPDPSENGGAGPSPTKAPNKGRGPYAYGGGPKGGPIIHIATTVLELGPQPQP